MFRFFLTPLVFAALFVVALYTMQVWMNEEVYEPRRYAMLLGIAFAVRLCFSVLDEVTKWLKTRSAAN